MSLAVLGLSLAIAYILMNRSRPWLGIALGLLPIVLFEAILHWQLDASIRACIDHACASAGLEPGCTLAEFGCTEWSGLSRFIFWVAGMADAVLYFVGVMVIAVAQSRRSKNAADQTPTQTV
jgi:hypothetical protein